MILLTAGKLILKQIAKQGLKKAAQSAVKQGVKKVAKSVTKKGVKKFAKRKAKDLLEERGGSIVRRDSSAAVKFVGGKSAKGGSATATLSPTKIGFGDINKQIDNIVGLTGSIDTIVKSQYRQKKEEAVDLRKEREDRRKRMRESLLEEKKARKKGGSGTIKGKGGKFDFMNFLTMMLLGTAILGLVNAIKSIRKIMDTLGLNLHQMWVIIRYVPKALMQAFGKAFKFIKGKAGKFLKTVGNKFKKIFGGTKNKIAKGLKAIAKGIKTFATGMWKTITEGAKAVMRGIMKGPEVVSRMMKNMPAMRGIGKGLSRVKMAAQATAAKAVTGVSKTVTGASKVTNEIVKKSVPSVLKHGLGRATNRTIIKFFGKNGAKAIANSGKLFKNLAKMAKGIKIPVVGPIIVLITSLLSGEGTNKALFKGFGALFGGMLAAPLGPLGMMAGELLGEVVGDVLYEGFMGKDGWKGAGAVIKRKWDGAIKTVFKIGKWMSSGFGRFWKWFRYKHGWNLGQLLNPFVTGPLLIKGFFTDEEPPGQKKDEDVSPEEKKVPLSPRERKFGKKSIPTTPVAGDAKQDAKQWPDKIKPGDGEFAGQIKKVTNQRGKVTWSKWKQDSTGKWSWWSQTGEHADEAKKDWKKQQEPGFKKPPLPTKSVNKGGTGKSTTGGEIGKLLDTIAFAEGTAGMPNNGYNTHFGHSQTEDLSKHPDKVITSGGRSSAAFGRYQFMPGTWASVGGGAMTPARQDWGATRLILMRLGLPQTKAGAAQLEKMLKENGLTPEIVDKLAPEWASFPNLIGPDAQGNVGTNTSYYGQGGKTLAQVQSHYKTAGGKSGTSIAQVADRGDALDTDDIPAANLEEGSETPDQTQGALIATGSQTPDKTQGITQSASYEAGASEELVVPMPPPPTSSGPPVVVARGGMMQLGSSSRDAIDTMQKERLLAALY